MKKTLLILGITILSFAGNAQNNSKEEKIKQLLELSGSGKIGIQVMNQMMDSFKKSFSAVPQEFWEEAKQEMKADDITNLITPIYAKYYTETDIDQLINFYNSPIGKKMVATMPQVVQESMTMGQQWGKEIGEKVFARLKEKGYLEK
ncbi:DUF2059 domain-containing protein [Flavobacterium daejeonense]|uniref:DUF2059 domain-containing protein n=1 Tax=Flavobacterium daejeonense TaxID=350893 RepID=UPI00047C6B11|nr:DUF2059 domain-containing protein [Flavobacterium daejeonense]